MGRKSSFFRALARLSNQSSHSSRSTCQVFLRLDRCESREATNSLLFGSWLGAGAGFLFYQPNQLAVAPPNPRIEPVQESVRIAPDSGKADVARLLAFALDGTPESSSEPPETTGAHPVQIVTKSAQTGGQFPFDLLSETPEIAAGFAMHRTANYDS